MWCRPNFFDYEGQNAFQFLASAINCTTFTFPEDLRMDLQEASKIAQLLLKSGCDPFAVDNLGRTPTMYMRHTRSEQIWSMWSSILSDIVTSDPRSLGDLSQGVSKVRLVFQLCEELKVTSEKAPCPHPGSCSICSEEQSPVSERLKRHWNSCRRCRVLHGHFDEFYNWLEEANPPLIELSERFKFERSFSDNPQYSDDISDVNTDDVDCESDNID